MNNKFVRLRMGNLPEICMLLYFCCQLISCSNTGPQTGSLSGTVYIEGDVDHSGVVIGVYETVKLNQDIVEANNKWPNIGVIIGQRTEFDHRESKLVKTGATDASGDFKITDIPTGKYNIVVIKNGYGFRYIYSVGIETGDNSLTSSKADVLLYPETNVNSDIVNPTTWQADHHYVVTQNINVDNVLTIEPGAIIRLDHGKDITVYGDVDAIGDDDNLIWFTKNDGFSDNLGVIESDSNYYWDRITFEEYSQAQVDWCKFDWANTALHNKINEFSISNSIFKHSRCGFKAESIDSIGCSNLLCVNIGNEEQGGIYYSQVSGGLIEKSIMFECQNGIRITNDNSSEVRNNYILDCDYAFYLRYNASAEIRNNEVENCNTAFFLRNECNPLIEYNNIHSTYGIFVYPENVPIVNYNNLNCEDYVIRLYGYEIYPFVDDIDAIHNYFYTTQDSQIEKLLKDKHDGLPYVNGEIVYKPFLNTPCYSAGIAVF